jgi:hypothetical protein
VNYAHLSLIKGDLHKTVLISDARNYKSDYSGMRSFKMRRSHRTYLMAPSQSDGGVSSIIHAILSLPRNIALRGLNLGQEIEYPFNPNRGLVLRVAPCLSLEHILLAWCASAIGFFGKRGEIWVLE